MENGYELVFAVVNSGFSGSVMDAARAAGATGGTVLRARGTANPDAEDFFGISIEPEKEIVMILASGETKDAILTAIYRECGLATAGQGIAFTLPVNKTVGIGKVIVDE